MKSTFKQKPFRIVFLILYFVLLSSCFGVNLDIVLNQNGGGNITLEYHISKALDKLGKLDGNERWFTVPVGKADFERSLDRLPDIKLLSFSSKEDQRDIVINAKMEFSSIKGLFAFLDASGRRSTDSGDTGKGSIILCLNEGRELQNPGLAKLIADISKDYEVKMSMTFPSEGTLSVYDMTGTSLTGGAEFNSKGKKVSFSAPLYNVLSSAGGMNLEFKW